MLTDNIAGIATAMGTSGINIIRISGSNVFDIIRNITDYKEEIIHGSIKYCHIIDPEDNSIIDECLVSFFISPKSYTMENVVEINCHGGIIVTNRILDIILTNNVRLAEAGEFTKRAFLNGRIDLIQAEAIVDLINSDSKKYAIEATKQLKGGLSKRLNSIKDIIINVIANIEVGNDYPEYEFDELSRETILSKIGVAIKELVSLKSTFEEGKLVKEGIKVAIVGKPNVGKSSLLNNILMKERAIVTEIEGTTRDVIEEKINIEGINIVISDTAGIRESNDLVETIGIEKSIEVIEESNLIICLFDPSKTISNEDKEIINYIKNKTSIYVINKIDSVNENRVEKYKKELSKYTNPGYIIEISAKENKGIDNLKKRIKELFNLEKINSDNMELITNSRHKRLIDISVKSLDEAINSINQNIPLDMICINLRNCVNSLNEITGDNVSEEVIHEIFSKFCVGK